jgi:hypothetical protein
METVNDSSKYVAQALELLKAIYRPDSRVDEPIGEVINLLEQALEKLTTSM